jgi:hypothetical protein
MIEPDGDFMQREQQADEPPSCLLPPIFMIGRDSRGNWVAQEQNGVCGGLFISRTEALKFTKFESGDRPHAVVMVSGILELDTSAVAQTGALQHADAVQRQSRAA